MVISFLATLVACTGLIVRNFLWQLFGKGNYWQAIERSWFQIVAVFVVVLVNHLAALYSA